MRVWSLRLLALAAVLVLLGSVAVAVLALETPSVGQAPDVETRVQQAVAGGRQNLSHLRQGPPLPYLLQPTVTESRAARAVLETYWGPSDDGPGCVALLDGRHLASSASFAAAALSAALGIQGAGTADCELALSRQLAGFYHPQSRLQALLLAAKIHRALAPAALLRLWSVSAPLGKDGTLYGVDEAARSLLGQPATALDWNSAAVLALALQFQADVSCTNIPKLTADRNALLERLARDDPPAAAAILAAKTEPLPCQRLPL